MAVLLQEMLAPELAFVLHTQVLLQLDCCTHAVLLHADLLQASAA